MSDTPATRQITNHESSSVPTSRSSRLRENGGKRVRQTSVFGDMGGAGAGAEDGGRNVAANYQEIQKKTLTKWVNAQLATVGDSISNLDTDLKDGKKLLKLLSVVSKEPAPKPERGNMRIHQLSNVSQALSFLESHLGDETMPNIGNEAIVNGDVKKTLALIFFIMLKYQIQQITEDPEEVAMMMEPEEIDEVNIEEDIVKDSNVDSTVKVPEEKRESGNETKNDLDDETGKGGMTDREPKNALKSPGNGIAKLKQRLPAQAAFKSSTGEKKAPGKADAKLALLYWVRTQLEEYLVASIIPPIGDFSSSWRNGLAFCLLIHHYDPELIPDLMSEYLQLDLNDKATWRTLLSLAFDTASQHMGIPKYLDAEDLIDVDFPDEPSVMMYVSEYYKIMSRPRKAPSVPKPGFKWSSHSKQESVSASHENTNVEEHNTDSEDVQVNSPVPSSTSNGAAKLKMVRGASPPPTPAPAQRKALNRLSSLGESDKARVKLNITNQLQQQLTGQLPFGIDLNLDQFISLHESILTFIKSHRQQINELSENIAEADAKSIMEYLDTLDTIEGECGVRSKDMAKSIEIKDKLEKQWKDDSSQVSIYLTIEQHTQILKMAETIESEWRNFNWSIQTTKERLLEKNLLIATHQVQVDDMEHQCEVVLAAIASKQYDVDSSCPTREVDGHMEKMHPLEATDDHAELYSMHLDKLEFALEAFTEAFWQPFLQSVSQTTPDIQTATHSKVNDCHEAYNKLYESFHEEQQKSRDFHRGITFVTVSNAIGSELDEVQSRMDHAKSSTTEDGIQDLEARVSIVRDMLSNFHERFADLIGDATDDDDNEVADSSAVSLDYYGRFKIVFDELENKYERVRDWVDQVRLWFVEAERIRKWIEVRIDIIEQEDKDRLESLDTEVFVSHEEILELLQAHEKLEREVERFNQDDMSRLRAHVKALTGSERQTKLSPADTTTIEITLMTLNILDRLMHMLRQHSAVLQELLLRILWEEKFEHAVVWVMDMDKRVDEFLFGAARWSMREEQFESDEDAHPVKTAMEKVISTLLDIEQTVADFDQGFYSETLDAYQDLEDAVSEDMPDYLTTRQTGLESTFEDLSKRIAFTRQAVEQHLAVMDLMAQFRNVKEEGENLRKDLSIAERTATADDSDMVFIERNSEFQQHSVHLVTNVAARIPYPTTPQMETALGAQDAHENELANQEIKSTVTALGMQLALIAEGIEQKLASYRHVLELQKRCKQLCDEMHRMTVWMEEKIVNIKQSKVNPAVIDRLPFDNDELLRLEKEKDGIQSRLSILEEGDLSELFENVRLLEVEVDASSSVAVDRSTVINSVEALSDQHQLLKKILNEHAQELDVVRKRFTWETHVNRCQQWISTTARKLSEFADKKAQCRPSIELSPSFGEDDDKAQTFQQLQNRLTEFTEKQLALAISSFEIMVEELSDILRDDEPVPGHIQDTQKQLLQTYHTLEELFAYVAQLLAQRSIYTEYALRSIELQREAEKLRDAIKKSFRRIMEDSNTTFESRIEVLKSEIENGRKECIDRLPIAVFDDSLTKLWSMYSQAKPDLQAGDSIKQTMKRKQAELDALVKVIEDMYNNLQGALNCKDQISMYNTELLKLQEWIIPRGKSLVASRINVTSDDLSALTKDYISEQVTALEQNEEEINEFETTRLRVVHDNIASLVQKILSQPDYKGLDVSSIANELERTLAAFRQLRDEITYQRNLIGTAEQRARYDEAVLELLALLQSFTEKLGILVVTRDALLTRNELTQSHLENFHSDLLEIDDEVQSSVKEMLSNCQSQYDAFVHKLTKLNPPLSEPEHLRLQLNRLQQSISQTDETVATRLKEHSLLERRLELDNSIQAALTHLQSFKSNIFKFIDEKAKWHSSADVKEKPDDSLQKHYEEKDAELLDYDQSTLSQLQDQFAVYKQETTFHGSQFLHHIDGKIEQMTQDRNASQSALEFAKNVVAQRLIMDNFIRETNMLEDKAVAIRNALTSSANVDEPSDMIDKFIDDVKLAKTNISSSLTFPVRPLDVTEQQQQRDELSDNVIQETVKARTNRLEELSESLKTLLKNREHSSRRASSIDSFKAQADTSKQWIEYRIDLIQSTMSKSETIFTTREMRPLVQEAESLDTAVDSYRHLYTSLRNECNATLTVLREDNGSVDVAQDIATLEKIQQELDDLWRELLQKLSDALSHLHSSYESKEYLETANNLLADLEHLLQTIMSVEPATVEDALLDAWQADINRKETRELKEIQDTIARGPQDLLSSDFMKLQAIVDQTEDIVAQIRKHLAYLYDQANINGLRRNYYSNHAPLQEQFANILTALSELLQQKCILPTSDPSTQDGLLDELLKQQFSIVTLVNDQSDAYNDLRSLYAFVMSQEHLADIETEQSELDESWSLIKEKQHIADKALQMLKQLSSQYAVLNKIRGNAEDREFKLQGLASSDGAEKESLVERLFEEVNADKSILEEMKEAARRNQTSLVENMLSVATNQEAFMEYFGGVLDHLHQQTASVKELQGQLSNERTVEQFSKDVADFVASQGSLYTSMISCLEKDDLVSSSEKLEALFTEMNLKVADVDDRMVFSQDAAESLRHRSNSIVNRWPGAKLEEAVQSVDQMMERLSLGQLLLSKVHDLVAKSLENNRDFFAITATLTTWKLNATQNVLEENHSESGNDTGYLEKLNKQMENFENTSLHEFEASCRRIESMCDELEARQHKTVTGIKDVVQSKLKSVTKDWNSLKAFLNHAQQNAEDNRLNTLASEKINELIRYVSDTTRHINSLQLSDPAVTVDVREFECLQKELKQALATKTQELDELFESKFTEDERVTELRSKVEAQVTDLHNLIQDRKEQTDMAAKLKEHMELIDQLDMDIGRVATSIDKLAPQHARLVENQLIKSDLQSMLQSLNQIREKRGKMIESQLVVVKKSSDALVNDWRADKRLGTIIDKWHKLQELMQVRGQELEICIQKLDHEFYTKLAAAKTTTRLTPRRPSLTPSTSSRTRSDFSFHRNSSKISLQSHSSTESYRRRRSKSPAPNPNYNNNLVKPHNQYLSDPNSDLDTEVGRIVNASPYRIKVKRVPGEVGKYWFGEENRRLVYCRILPSKLVMVRVGGGWVELAQFLSDHGMKEGTFTRVKEDLQTKSDNLIPPRATSPSGRVVLRGGGGLATPNVQSRLNGPGKGTNPAMTAGYKDGNTFVRIDEQGNHVVAKMTKAKDSTIWRP
ncbi:hypothetical protein INT43_007456 [Umbelopsis isabellina]|uniref:Calponin-homology (CH) domain-containing protein n=1 Tax=Mortierella isabellina TaxID=91625 RepID=A0A8H7UGU1_MORIS|nr:hypothetical protein INT43_007456 [Umbelopsis isabellina]